MTNKNIAVDSREKLEADILDEPDSWLHTPYGFRRVRGWLDRQGAITERELEDTFLDRAEIIITRREMEKRDLQQQVDELAAERDELNALIGGDNRVAERLRGVAADMRSIGASSMTPHELFAYWAGEVDKAADLAATLGGGECECDGTIEWQWTGPTTYYEHELSCGHVITSMDNEPPSYCEECGAKVRKAVKR